MEYLFVLPFVVPLVAILALRARAYNRGVRLPWFYGQEDVKPFLSEAQLRTYKNFRFRAVPVALIILVPAWFARSENPELFYLLLGISATISGSGAVWLEYVLTSARAMQPDMPAPVATNLTEQMVDVVDFIPAAVGTAIGVAAGGVSKSVRDRGRGQWMKAVGRPPRDLYANHWINVFANLIHEWAWIGFSIAFVGFVMMFVQGGIWLYVMGAGIGMILVRAFGTPLCLRYAELAPQYEAQAAATRSAHSPA